MSARANVFSILSCRMRTGHSTSSRSSQAASVASTIGTIQ